MTLYIVVVGSFELDSYADKYFLDKELAYEYASRVKSGHEYVDVIERRITESLGEYEGRLWSISASVEDEKLKYLLIDDSILGDKNRPMNDILNDKSYLDEDCPTINMLSNVDEGYNSFKERAYEYLELEYRKWEKEQYDNSK